ncbi:hypothetical protein TNCV_2081 [Trichonephila clavipes]|nr:hypothetical protein TNCV_2081 [Trichonephila clavipes]
MELFQNFSTVWHAESYWKVDLTRHSYKVADPWGRPSCLKNVNQSVLHPTGRSVAREKRKGVIDLLKFVSPIQYGYCATETSRNKTARVIERDTSGDIYYFLENARGFRTRQHGHQSHQIGHQLGRQNYANLALPPGFRQVLIESPL